MKWSTVLLVHISMCLNGTSSHKWDGLCQHEQSVEMGILMTTSSSTRVQEFNLQSKLSSVVIDPITLAIETVANVSVLYLSVVSFLIIHILKFNTRYSYNWS